MTSTETMAAPATGQAAPRQASTAAKARRREIVRGLLRSPTFLIGAVILLFWVVDAIFWQSFAPHDPQQIFPQTLQGPSGAHLFGTDNLGRDVLSRLLAGASPVLTVAPAATALGLAGGVALGLFTGYYRGVLDDVAMRIVDAVLAFPLVIIAVLVLTVLGSGELPVILLIAVTFVPGVARTVRAAVLTQRELEYVAAAKLAGASGPKIMFTEILPNVTGPIIVEGTVRLGYAIFTSATLSFLTLGIQQPSPDWGLTISLGQVYLQVAPWIVLFPALALATLVVAVNLVADGFQRVLDA
ncbi:ABC transporter permease [Amycolatopsis sp. NPDC051372]|uniref:ABC transporter permease n=1 Tax=Amycolatopsis sp. NPDC051372 TaxID=3155669 RepID=UPI00343B6B00